MRCRKDPRLNGIVSYKEIEIPEEYNVHTYLPTKREVRYRNQLCWSYVICVMAFSFGKQALVSIVLLAAAIFLAIMLFKSPIRFPNLQIVGEQLTYETGMGKSKAYTWEEIDYFEIRTEEGESAFTCVGKNGKSLFSMSYIKEDVVEILQQDALRRGVKFFPMGEG